MLFYVLAVWTKTFSSWVNSFHGYLLSQLGLSCTVFTLTAHLCASLSQSLAITRQRSLAYVRVDAQIIRKDNTAIAVSEFYLTLVYLLYEYFSTA